MPPSCDSLLSPDAVTWSRHTNTTHTLALDRIGTALVVPSHSLATAPVLGTLARAVLREYPLAEPDTRTSAWLHRLSDQLLLTLDHSALASVQQSPAPGAFLWEDR